MNTSQTRAMLHEKHFGLVGKTLKHSFSKQFFKDLFKKNEIIAKYELFEIENTKDISILLSQNFSGLNVTIPYKESIIPFLDKLSPEAKKIGAVNCIQFLDKQTIGHNTDVYGFHQLIKPYLTKEHQKTMILGTGGVAKAVEYVLKQIGIDCIFISRKPKKDKEFHYSEVNNYMIDACKLIVNCTPLGMFPNTQEYPKIPFQCLTNEHLIIDLIYNPSQTLFLQKSKEQKAQILNGHTMLVQQALKSWEIWNTHSHDL